MADTFTVINKTDKPVRLEFMKLPPSPGHPKAHYDVFDVPACGSLPLPIRYFRALFSVRCSVPKCRELGYCTKGHRGDMVPAQSNRLTYEPIGEGK